MKLSQSPVDAAEAWERFSAAWPFDPVPYRRAAARVEFEKLTEAEREEAIKGAAILARSRRSSGRMAAPDARRWLKEKLWKSISRPPISTGRSDIPDKSDSKLDRGTRRASMWKSYK